MGYGCASRLPYGGQIPSLPHVLRIFYGLRVRFAPDSSDRLRQTLRAVSERSGERVLTKSLFGGTINFSKAVA